MPTLELEIRRAPFAPATWNAEARTVEAVISTGADVQRRDSRGPFTERLDLSQIDSASLVGLPVLTDHRQGVVSTVGVIAEARREAGNLVATIRFSAAADAADAVTKVAEGVLRGLSIGYAAMSTRETTEGGRRIRTVAPAIREVSLVPIPADPASLIRSHSPMPEVLSPDPLIDTPQPAIASRAAINAQIRALADTTGLDREWADAQIDTGADIDTVRSAALDALVERGGPALRVRAHVGPSNDDPAVIIERQSEALAARMGGAEASEAARPFMAYGFADFARDALVRAGVNVSTMSRETMIERAMHTTSDFPLMLEQGGTRVVSNAYTLAESPLKQVATRRTVQDLRDVTILKAGEMSELHEVTESGEIKSLSHGEAAEGYPVRTYGGIFTLSRKLLINDQFGVFGQSAIRIGTAAAQAEANALVGLLTQSSGAGPVMSDGTRLFHADHGNLAASGGALAIATLSTGRAAMRKQKGLDKKSPVNVTPAFLVVGPDQETAGEQILATLASTKADDVNPFSGKLTLIVEPRIVGNAWYLFGDKATAPVLEMAYLASAPGPQIATRDGWEVLGREYRVTLDLGVGATDWRGAYRNAGG